MMDVKEACGVFGAYDLRHGQVFQYIYWGLISQNHRGHQSHGFLTYEKDFHIHKSAWAGPQDER
jgi:amidophosphoribosyltransferase